MTECWIDVEDNAKCECDNCDWTGEGADLEMISDIQERLSPGSPVPAGQCPKCGALAYLAETPDWAKQKVVIEVTGGVAEVTTCPEGVDVNIIDHDNAEEDHSLGPDAEAAAERRQLGSGGP